MSTRTVSKTISLDSFPKDAASKYITKINNMGITIHPEDTVNNKKNILINSSGISIRDNELPMMVLDNDSLDFNAVDTSLGTYTTMATFGLTGATIGQSDGTHAHLELTNSHMKFIGNDGVEYVDIGDSISGTIQQAFRGDGIQTDFLLLYYSSDILSVIVDDVATSAYTVVNDDYGTHVVFNTPPSTPDDPSATTNISIDYEIDIERNKAFTIGTRQQGTLVGMQSYVFGTKCNAEGKNSFAEGYRTFAMADFSHAQGLGSVASEEGQTAIGKYGDPFNQHLAFLIGNGTSSDARSNALTVDWDGRLKINNVQPSINSGTYIQIRHSSIDSDGTPPTSSEGTIYSGAIYNFDTDGARIGHFENYYDTSGNIGMNIGSSRIINGSPKYNNITSIIKADGTYAYSVSSAVAFRKAINIYSTYTFYTASATNQTISATSNKTVTITIPAATMSGKTILAIRGWNFNNSSSGGQGCSVCVPYSCIATGNTVTLEIRNNASSTSKIDVYVYCVLVENNS